jgi:probable F420-dependent oxidoreductase
MKIALSERYTGVDGRDQSFVTESAQLVESLGFSTLWHPKYLFHMKHYESKYPYGSLGHDGPEALRGFYDPIVNLAVIGQVTSRMRLGTYPTIVTQYSPVVLARALSTLDHACQGRLDVGVGAGWSREEFQAVGVDFDTRGRRTDDYLAALVALWSDEEWSEFSSDTVTFGPMHSYPKPIQRPHPPLIITGTSRAALRRTAQIAQGWAGVALEADQVARTLDDLEVELQRAGRHRHELTLRTGRKISADGTGWDDDLKFVRRCADLGLDEVVISSPDVSTDAYENTIRRLADAFGATN